MKLVPVGKLGHGRSANRTLLLGWWVGVTVEWYLRGQKAYILKWHRFKKLWVRNRAGENRPGDIRPNHFVYTSGGTRVSTHVSTRVGAFVWDYNTDKANFCGHSRVHLREHSREHLREPFRGSIGGSYFAFASSVLHCVNEGVSLDRIDSETDSEA